MCPNRSHSGSASGLLLAALLLAPVSAGAQGRTFLKPTVAVSQEYDSNVVALSDAESSLVTRVDARLSAERSSDVGHIRVGGGVRSSKVWEFSDLNATDPSANYEALLYLTPRLSAFSSGSYAHRSKYDELEDGGEVLLGGRPDVDRWNAGGGLSYRLDPRSTLKASIRHEDESYGDALIENRPYFDRETDLGELSYYRQVTPRDMAQILFSYSESTYTRDRNALERQFPDFFPDPPELEQDLISGTAVWTRDWAPEIRSVLSGGTTQVRSRQDGQSEDKQNSFVGGVTIERTTARGQLALSYSRVVRPASGTRRDQLVESVQLGLARHLLGSLEARLDASWRRFRQDRFTEPVGLASRALGESDVRSVIVSGHLSWRMSRRLVTFVDVSYYDQGSYGSVPEREYDRTRVRFGARYSFEQDF